MSAPNKDHPAPPDLHAFGLGQLDPARSGEIEMHVAGCDSCCQALQSVSDDTLVNQLREALTLGRPVPAIAPPASALTLEWHPAHVPADLARHPRYHIRTLLGRGGMGAVYQAEHAVMRRLVALKIIDRKFTADAPAVERFQREIRAAARLHHPNIVAAYDAEQAGDTHFLVMEYIDGVSLDRVVKAQGPLPVAEACNAVRQAALGLHHAHEQGMVHRDMKPGNLIRSNDGVVKVLDFGLAEVASERAENRLTGVNVVMGTPDFIAPEQAEDTRAADKRADVYALGCTLYFLLTGRPPFCRPSTLLTPLAHRDETAPSVNVARRDLPAGLAAVLERMMAKAPADRFQSAADVAEALAPFAAPKPAPRRGKPRRRWLVAAAAAVLFVGALAAAAVVIRIPTPRGDVTIETDDPSIEVVVTGGGKLVRLVDPRSKQTWELDPEKYTLGMADRDDGLTFELPGKEPFVLKRKDQKLVTIARGPAPATERVGDKVWLEGYDDVVWGVAFSRDGRYTLTSGRNPLRDRTDNRSVPLLSHGGWFVAFSPDGRRALTGDPSVRSIILWNVETGEEVRRFGAPTDRVLNAGFSPDGKRVAASVLDTVFVWDAATGAELMRVPTQHDCRPGFAFTPDGRRLLVIHSDNKSIHTYEVETGKEVEPRLTTPDPVCALALSPDGKTVLATRWDADDVLVWDAVGGKVLPRLVAGQKLKTFDHRQVAFLPDGRRALVTNFDGTMILWDVPTAHEIQRWEDQGHIVSLAISPDGRWAFCGRWDKKAFLFRLPDPPAADKVLGTPADEKHP